MRKRADDLQRGDVILSERGEKYTVDRVVRDIEKRRIYTTGDQGSCGYFLVLPDDECEVESVEDRIVAAGRDGWPVREIMETFGVSRHHATKVLDAHGVARWSKRETGLHTAVQKQLGGAL